MPMTNKLSRKKLESDNGDPEEWEWNNLVDNRQREAPEPLDVVSESWIVACDIRSNYRFEKFDSLPEEKLEKNKDLDHNKGVGIRDDIVAILESGKSKEEIIDLLVERIDPESVAVSSKTKMHFQAASKVDTGPLPENPVLYADRKLHPEYAHLDAVEFLRAVWGPWMEAGTVYQDDIRRVDRKLINAIDSYCQRQRIVDSEFNKTTKDFLPPRHYRTEKDAQSVDPKSYKAQRSLERRKQPSYSKLRAKHY